TSCSVDLTLSAQDSESGVRSMRLSNDGEHWLTVPFQGTFPWNLADPFYGGTYGQSTYTAYVTFVDYEGNESAVYQDSISKQAGAAGLVLLHGHTFRSIQDALDAAAPGDTVL